MKILFQFAYGLRLFQFILCKEANSNVSRYFHTDMLNSSVIHAKRDILEEFNRIVPPLNYGFHKGQAGRVGVIGGSEEYTGAPYFAAITALKVGADLSHVICAQSASPVIKSYSPELIVHPLLDKENAIGTIKEWLSRFHAVVIGPGLGRDPKIMKTVKDIIAFLKSQDKPIVIDADGLFIVTQDPEIVKGYKKVILTPNVVEFRRLVTALKLESGSGDERTRAISETISLSKALGHVTIVRKGPIDIIVKGDHVALVDEEGSPRRCGGQGDLLSGAMNAFAFWAYRSHEEDSDMKIEPSIIAAYAASVLTRRCAAEAFAKHQRSMTTSNLIEEIGPVFKNSKL